MNSGRLSIQRRHLTRPVLRMLVILMLMWLVAGCERGDLPPFPPGLQADAHQLRFIQANHFYVISHSWFRGWSGVPISFANFNRTQQHRIIIVHGEAAKIAAIVAAAAQRPDFAPPPDPAVLSSTPLVPPSSADALPTYSLSFVPPEPGDYVYLCTVPGHYQAGMWGTLTLVDQ